MPFSLALTTELRAMPTRPTAESRCLEGNSRARTTACALLLSFCSTFAIAQPANAPKPLPPAAVQFFAAVRAHFAAWDRNHDGQLTREEIEIDMQDARITGEAAAAL